MTKVNSLSLLHLRLTSLTWIYHAAKGHEQRGSQHKCLLGKHFPSPLGLRIPSPTQRHYVGGGGSWQVGPSHNKCVAWDMLFLHHRQGSIFVPASLRLSLPLLRDIQRNPYNKHPAREAVQIFRRQEEPVIASTRKHHSSLEQRDPLPTSTSFRQPSLSKLLLIS